MAYTHIAARMNKHILACALAAIAAPWTASDAATQIDQHRPANPQGSVEILNLAGAIEVKGWDKSEVAVTGSIGNDVDRVDVTGEGNRTSIRVVLRSQHKWGSGSEGEAHLLVNVPANSSISTSLVSSDLKVSSVRGDVQLQTVSGNVNAEVGGDVHANSVSGNVVLTATAARTIEARTVSGDLELNGGDADAQASTVSGNAKISLRTPVRARFHTVSGDISASLGVGSDAQIDGESVSGSIRMEFASAPAADFDVQTFSGDIENCFGPKPVEPQHGPGSRLTFKTGNTQAHVRLSTKSGDVRLCTKKS